MALLGCSEIRPLLAASYDGELPVEDHIAVETHVARCALRAGETRRVEAVSRALRATVVSSGTLATELAGLSATVVSRMNAERGQSVGARFGCLFEDMHMVWAVLVAATATALCAVLIAAAMYGTWPDGFASGHHDGDGRSGIQREPRAPESENPGAPSSVGGGDAGDAGESVSCRR